MLKSKLLIIEMDNINSVPTVRFNGEDITGRVSVRFDWHTQSNNNDGHCNIHLKHLTAHNVITTTEINRGNIKNEISSEEHNIHVGGHSFDIPPVSMKHF